MQENVILKATINGYETVRDRVKLYRDSICAINSKWNIERDLRVRILGQLYNLLTQYNVSLVFIRDNYVHPENLAKLLSLDTMQDARSINFDLHTFYKNGYIYNVSSIVEAFSRIIANYLGVNKGSYYSLQSATFKHLGLQTNDEWKAMRVLAFIRNGIHNNGIHRPLDGSPKQSQISYRGREMNFVDGLAITGVTDELLISISADILSFFKLVIQSNEIMELECVEDPSITWRK
ncbi:hypothetical protein [Dyadobacter crusticola]|uniref:hypothetical protein n=1 Tax=Dyadobacter crusticola TaxID=292407 RepID=UPI0004E1DAC9|nr:hypothetical protein [Dyadobacter crusticola]